jgi:hypothetical protein
MRWRVLDDIAIGVSTSVLVSNERPDHVIRDDTGSGGIEVYGDEGQVRVS